MSQKKKQNRVKNWLLVFSIIVIAGLLFIFTPTVAKRQEIKDPFSQPKETELPIVIVRQDSVIALFNYLCKKNQSTMRVDSGSVKSLSVHLDRFTSTPSIIYCNSPSIMNMSSPGFKLVVHPSGEVDLAFSRGKKGTRWYVAVPTDIMCGLMKFHPDIR